MDGTEQQDEANRRAQECLAKAAYIEWATATISDGPLKAVYTRRSAEWRKEAENKNPDQSAAGAEVNEP